MATWLVRGRIIQKSRHHSRPPSIEVAIGPDGGMFPCGRVDRDRPAPNVFELGVAAAFERVRRPTDCNNCWCTLTLAGCFLYRGDARLLL